jgi:hypothetical protein
MKLISNSVKVIAESGFRQEVALGLLNVRLHLNILNNTSLGHLGSRIKASVNCGDESLSGGRRAPTEIMIWVITERFRVLIIHILFIFNFIRIQIASILLFIKLCYGSQRLFNKSPSILISIRLFRA